MQLEAENEQMFHVLNEYDKSIPQIVEEAITSKETQWKTAMNEVVSNSQIELKSLQDQLILSKREIDSLHVSFLLFLLSQLSLHDAQEQTRQAQLEIDQKNRELSQQRESLSYSSSSPFLP